MRVALVVLWLPLLVAWVLGGVLLRLTGSERLRAERLWLVFPVLAVYLAAIVHWVLLPVVLVIGGVLYRFRDRLQPLPAAGLRRPGRPPAAWPTIERESEPEGR